MSVGFFSSVPLRGEGGGVLFIYGRKTWMGHVFLLPSSIVKELYGGQRSKKSDIFLKKRKEEKTLRTLSPKIDFFFLPRPIMPIQTLPLL